MINILFLTGSMIQSQNFILGYLLRIKNLPFPRFLMTFLLKIILNSRVIVVMMNI